MKSNSRLSIFLLSLLSLSSLLSPLQATAAGSSQTVYAYCWTNDVDLVPGGYVSPEEATVGSSTFVPASTNFTVTVPRGYKVSYWAWSSGSQRSESAAGLINGVTSGIQKNCWTGQTVTEATTFEWSYSSFKSCGTAPALGVRLDPIPYNIAFNKGADAATGSMSEMKIPSFFLTTNLTANAYSRTGYGFYGWATNSATMKRIWKDKKRVSGASFDAIAKSNDTVTLYACWTAIVYTVTFNPNGGSVSPTSKSVTYDAAYGDLPTPTWTGHAFKGWYTAAEGGDAIASDTTVATASDHTLYARWDANSYAISTGVTGTGSGTVSGAGTYAYGTTATLTASANTGSAFVRWTDGDTTNPRTVTVTGDASYTAEFALQGYAVTFSFKDEYGGSTSVVQTVAYGGAATAPDADHWIGHHFLKWSPESFSVVTSTHTEIAQYEENNYTIRFDGNGGTCTLDPISTSYSGTVTLPKAISSKVYREGYTFQGWSVNSEATTSDYQDGEQVSHLSATDGGVVILYAIWKPIEYAIAFAPGEEGVTGTMPTMTGVRYDVVTNLPLNAYSKQGYVFDHWQLGSSTTNFTDGAAVSNLTTTAGVTNTLTARWSQWYAISFEKGAADAVGAMPVTNFVVGVAAPLPSNVFTRTGYTFQHWSATTNGTSATFADKATVTGDGFTVGATNKLTAVWLGNTYYVRFKPGCADATGTMKDQEFIYGIPQNLSPNVYSRDPELWSFTGWSNTVSGACYADEAEVSNLTTVAGDTIELVAIWESKLSDLSKALDCDNLNWTNHYDEGWQQIPWTVTNDLSHKGGTCVVQACEGGDATVQLSATIHTNGTLTFYWMPTANAAKLSVQLVDPEGKKTDYVIRSVGTLNTWNSTNIEVTLTTSYTQSDIRIFHENSVGEGFLYIDHVIWTPEGGSAYPVPTEADRREATAVEMTAEGLSLSFTGDANFAYHLLATDSLAPILWYDFGETNIGTGASQSFAIPIDDSHPQRFFKIETLQRK